MDYKTAKNADDGFAIRIPLDMMQYTEVNGKTWPAAFKWPDVDGIPTEVKIDWVKRVSMLAEQKSGTVGDRYECEIEKSSSLYEDAQRGWHKPNRNPKVCGYVHEV